MKSARRPSLGDSGSRDLGGLVHVGWRPVAVRALLLGSLLCALVAVPFLYHYRAEVGRALDRAKARERAVVALIAQGIGQDVAEALADLRFLSHENDLREYLEDDGPARAERLAREYVAFVAQTRRYDQVRVIGADGRERVRVNFNDGAPAPVPAEALQSKRDRPYFQETMRLRPHEVHVSALDLNIEHGEIASPPKPMIRFSLPLFDAAGRRAGALVLNYLGEHLIRRARAIARTGQGQLWLLDATGGWLIGPDPRDEWALLYPGGEGQSLAARHPDLWRAMVAETEGELPLAGGWIGFRQIYPLAGDYATARAAGLAVPPAPQTYRWTVAVLLPGAPLQAARATVARNLAGGYGLLALLCFALAGLFAFLSLRGRALGAALARVVDHVPDLIAYVDASQRCRFHNRAYERFLGRGPREICGRTVRELLGDPAFETLRPAIERALAGEEVSFEVRIEFPGIGPRDVSVSYVPDTDPFGALAGFVSFMRDVTPVKEAERRERQRMLELAHVARVNSLGQMATEIAHEVNQPLAAISAYCAACLNSLQTAPQEGARLREWLEAIRAETVRVSEVVRRLRALVQRGERAHRPVDLNDLVEGVTRMLLGEARAQGVALETSLTPGLPGVVGDQVLLEQVVLNLLLNALDSLAEAPPERRRITVGTRRADDGVSVAVADSGPGVPADLEERLFEPFFSTKAEGLGMGLVISRSIVEAHGGRLEHGSAPGGGAIFTFTLPAAHP